MTGTMNIKDLVGAGKTVTFKHYRQGNLYYESSDGFMFPVPIADCADATFMATDKAILFMRYIRKEIENRQQPEDQPSDDQSHHS